MNTFGNNHNFQMEYLHKVFSGHIYCRMSLDIYACALCAGQRTGTCQMLECTHEVMLQCQNGWHSPHDEDLCYLHTKQKTNSSLYRNFLDDLYLVSKINMLMVGLKIQTNENNSWVFKSKYKKRSLESQFSRKQTWLTPKTTALFS